MPRKAIEALGVRERNVEWEVTLCTAADRNCLLQLPAIAINPVSMPRRPGAGRSGGGVA